MGVIDESKLNDILPKYDELKLSGKNLAQNYVSAFNTGMNIYQCVNQLQGYIEWVVKAVNDVVKLWNAQVGESIDESKAIVRETTTEQFNVEWRNKQPQLIEQVNALTTKQFNQDWGVLENRINTTLETQNTNIENIQNEQNILFNRVDTFINNNYATPEMFGAVGDGITDDSDSLSKFFNSNYSLKVMRNTTYFITKEISIEGKEFVLLGNNATIKLGETITTGMYIFAYNKNTQNIYINNVTFDGNSNGNNSQNPLIRVFAGKNKIITNVIFENCSIINSFGHGIAFYNETDSASNMSVSIVKSNITNCNGVGIIQSKASSLIEECYITKTGAEGITIDNGCENCRVLNCKIEKYGHGGGIGIDTATNIHIDGCTIDGSITTASLEYSNGITINGHTGVSDLININNNTFVNNAQAAIEIGDVQTTDKTHVINKCNITNNMFKNNEHDIYILLLDDKSEINAHGNNYDKGNYTYNTVTDNAYCKSCNIDYDYLPNINAGTGFTIFNAKCVVKNKKAFIVCSIKNTNSSVEGFRAGVILPFNIKNDFTITNVCHDGNTLTYKDVAFVGNEIKPYIVKDEVLKTIPINISVEIS